MASASFTHIPEHNQDDYHMSSPKPLSSDPDHLTAQPFVAELVDVTSASSDPPPPYPSSPRTGRRVRANTTRGTRRTAGAQVSDDPQVTSLPTDSGSELETTPLLGGHPRRTSHSSTVHPVQSLAHTVISSSRTMISLFQADPDSSIVPMAQATSLSSSARAKRYLAPLTQRTYYAALFHLLFINFPFELVAWIYLFVGTLTGTTLLITLPIGLIICFLDVLGARILARCEIALQTRFHGPLIMSPPNPPHPIFSRMRIPRETDPGLEHGRQPATSIPETSFLRLSFLMFSDPTSYQALFYFLVIKPGLTLLITLSLLILVPPAFILVVPAPAVLRAVRRVGIWQAEVAIDALS